MDFPLKLYSALLELDIPPAKASAVVKALEADMNTYLATKQDLSQLAKLMRLEIANQALSLKLWLGGVVVVTVGSVLAMFQYFLR